MTPTDTPFAAILTALANPAAYATKPAKVDVIETHISAVFLAGSRAYKVKKPVQLAFLDFSTLARREHFCREEVRLNAALAPGVYREVVPIRRGTTGLHVGGSGELVDWAVEMERLPAADMLDALLDRGHIDNEMLVQLAQTLARFHADALTGEGVDAHGDLAAVRALVQENFAETDRFLVSGSLHALDRDVHDLLEAWALNFLHERAELFEQRVQRGRIRDGHGDLHAGNICYRAPALGGLVIYDRIEFSARFRCCDVAADLAFLLMDLDHRGYRGFSDYLLREYIARSGDAELIGIVDFYKSYRAFVRGKVTALRATQMRGPARDAARLLAMSYFNLAAGYAVPPSVILLCGLPGTGKSHASAQFSTVFDCTVCNSDSKRKQQAAVPLREHHQGAFATGIYDAQHTEATYAALLADTEAVLAKGRSVVVDAGFRTAKQRAPFLAMARARRVPVVVLHLDPPETVVVQRLLQREAKGRSESDAGVAVYAECKRHFEPPLAAEGAPVLVSQAADLGPEFVTKVVGGLLAQAEIRAD